MLMMKKGNEPVQNKRPGLQGGCSSPRKLTGKIVQIFRVHIDIICKIWIIFLENLSCFTVFSKFDK